MSKDKSVKVRFLAPVAVHDENGDITFQADEGEVVEVSHGSAARWSRRGKAERVPANTRVGKAGSDDEPPPDPENDPANDGKDPKKAKSPGSEASTGNAAKK